MDRARGFTTLETMIALLLAGLLLAVAVPIAKGALAAADAASARADLLATLTTAVREASIRGAEVVICPSDGGACLDTFDWSAGWIAYADVDGNRRRSTHEPMVHRVAALPAGVQLLTTKGRKRLVIQPSGGNAGSNVTFTLCDGRGNHKAMELVLANNGRLRSGAARRTCAPP